MTILRRRLEGKVAQWDSACRKEGLIQSPSVTCHADTRWQTGDNVCLNSRTLQETAKRSNTSMEFWPIGGGACNGNELRPC
ncbi:hypothetical protein CYMTET_29953 [Cymbomonas tetramitiformis]|uniref:Uncharacterized protein n=1 Tax=Cymbomonas tetramitiformis TaxID=36881 RepID=A0AAE0FJY0_9CHLO|nr:hypothetical protein CYMTET_29953 [Cymbomonas tetramitiformis]